MTTLKLFLTAIALVVFSSPAWAKNFTLKAGESVNLYGDVITCQAPMPEDLFPACTIKKSGFYDIYIGADKIDTYPYIDDAIEAIKELRQAQLCR